VKTCLPSILLALAFIGFSGVELRAQMITGVPKNAQDIKVDEKLGKDIPANLVFMNDRGESIQLGKFFDGKRPVILTLNYSDCPGLCIAQLNGLTEGVSEMFGLSLGPDFQMVSISIDPRETVEKVAKTKARYATLLPREHHASGWHFLTGDGKSIQTIAEAVGFKYSYDPKSNRYNHGSVAVLISPKGMITRYLYSVKFEPETLRLSLVEASDGKLGSTSDQFLLWCFHYNPEENRYSADAKRILSFAAGAFVLIGMGISIPFWFSRPPAKAGSSDELSESDSTSSSSAQS
jgi:protein SCO1